MSTSTITCATKFIGHLRYIEPTRSKTESLMNKGAIVRRDIEQIYNGLYLEVFCSFEQFIENLFIGLLVNRFNHPSSHVIPRVTFKSDLVAREVVYGGNRYVNWLPYNHTEQRARAFFRNGLPFTSLQSRDKQLIEQFCYIRNAIAHNSSNSKKIFERKVIGSIPITPRDRTPSGFLRTKFRISPVQTRYENFIVEMAGIALKLCLPNSVFNLYP